MQEEAEEASCNSSAPWESESCWPVEGDLWAQAGTAFSTARMWSGAHSQEENNRMTSTDQTAELFNVMVLAVDFGGHISTIISLQINPCHYQGRRNTSRECGALNSAMCGRQGQEEITNYGLLCYWKICTYFSNCKRTGLWIDRNSCVSESQTETKWETALKHFDKEGIFLPACLTLSWSWSQIFT